MAVIFRGHVKVKLISTRRNSRRFSPLKFIIRRNTISINNSLDRRGGFRRRRGYHLHHRRNKNLPRG